MHELIINLHMHTVYSDGHVLHSDIGQAALRAGIDAVIVTDHNVYVEGMEGYYQDGDRQILLLIGEEIHDQARKPQKNHLLVFGAGRELSTLAWDPQRLMDGVRQAGGLSFLAHPVDPAAPAIHENDISWEDWQVQGYTGIELWNAMSEFKSLIKSRLHGLYYAYRPERVAHGPFPEALRKWDELLAAGQHIVAIGGTDAHAFQASMGPIRRTLFPYEWHFKTINTHLLVEHPLSGDLESDRQMILQALKKGCVFIGYDLAAPTRGFRFTAHGFEQTAILGEEISAQRGVTLQIHLPRPASCRLIRNGETVQAWENQESCMHITTSPGAYRVEAHIDYQGQRRAWILSNPIYIKKSG
jgi:hypothetical protein